MFVGLGNEAYEAEAACAFYQRHCHDLEAVADESIQFTLDGCALDDFAGKVIGAQKRCVRVNLLEAPPIITHT